MSDLKITFELAAEDRARLDAILERLKDVSPRCDNCTRQFSEAIQFFVANTNKQEAPASVIPFSTHPATVEPPATVEDVVPWETPAEEAPVKKYTLEEVRRAVMSASRKSADVKAKVKALLNEYAPSVPALPAEKYAEFMGRLSQEGLV